MSTVADFPKEKLRPNGRQTDADIVKAFGTDAPPATDVVLHYYPGWEQAKGVPVLLVHGTILDATSTWIKPHDQKGLAKSLAEKGHRVFAVTFANRHGDNILQAEQVAWAIERIKQVTNAAEVDVVAHSKGAVVARTLASDVRYAWMPKFKRDIRRLVLVAGPHLGLDTTFRHPIINYGLYPEKSDSRLNAPMSWTGMLVLGVWVDTSAQTMFKSYGDYFPGQAQMLARWDKEYPLPQTEVDWYTTYHGGQGFLSRSPGIDQAIEDGGHFIDLLRRSPLVPNLQLAVLAGNRADLAGIHNEHTGPSDGVVFVKSATATDDMTRAGAKLIAKDLMHLNHMDLVIAPQAHTWVADVLR
ncbi:Alpha/beta hydrolase family protein [compost metagenome]